MQEMNLSLKVNDIEKGETPPKEGHYTLIERSVDDKVMLEPVFWDTGKGGWRSFEKSDTVLMPTSYWGRYWTDDITATVTERIGK